MSKEQFGSQSFLTLLQSSYGILPSLAVLVRWEPQEVVAGIDAAFAERCWTAGGAETRRFDASDVPLALQRHVQWRVPCPPNGSKWGRSSG